MRFLPSSWPNILLTLLLLVVGLELGFLGLQNGAFSLPAGGGTLKEYAASVLGACEGAKYRPSCYDEQIPLFMSSLSMEEAFQVTRLVQDEDDSYQYCHVLGHTLSALEVAKDPKDWKDVVTRCPSGLCSNGCIHGGFQERFREGSFTQEEIVEIAVELETLCEPREGWNPTGLEQGSCYHALGHLTMYLTEAELPQALEICDQVGLKTNGRDWRQLCYDGAFMQIFQPLEPEDFALIEGKVPLKEELSSYCGAYEGRQQASCLSESWPLFATEIRESEGLVAFCGMTEEEHRPRCFNAMFYVVTAQMGFDSSRIAGYCLGMPETLQGRCFANAASRMIETDWRNTGKSASLCAASASRENEETCFAELLQYSTYNFHAGSKEFFELCEALPGQWHEKCLAQSVN